MLSMTGYGVHSQTLRSKRATLEVSVEIRTVNSKFLDIAVRSPKAYMVFDVEVNRLVRTYFKRGRVDVHISRRVLEGVSREVSMNLDEASQILEGFRKVKRQLKLGDEVAFSDLMAVKDWIETHDAPINTQVEWGLLKKIIGRALEKVAHDRSQEGKAIERVIREHRREFEKVFEKVASKNDEVLERSRIRLKDKIRDFLGNQGFDPHRLEQEVSLLVARSDFQEEVDRIRHHLETFDRLMAEEGEQGRKLEFLVQELHREVNTLGSKCGDPSLTPLIIQLKTNIERIREQLQNSE